jgi:hypothetical protein
MRLSNYRHGLGALGVAASITANNSDGSHNLYASPSGMIGREINQRWCLGRAMPGVVYRTDYGNGTVIEIQNYGDGTYALRVNGYLTTNRYAARFLTDTFFDARGTPQPSAAACTAPGDPVGIYFQPGVLVRDDTAAANSPDTIPDRPTLPTPNPDQPLPQVLPPATVPIPSNPATGPNVTTPGTEIIAAEFPEDPQSSPTGGNSFALSPKLLIAAAAAAAFLFKG